MSDNTYTCAVCHGTYEKGWTDEEAESEKQELWGDVSNEYCAVVCDDCFQAMKPTEQELEAARQAIAAAGHPDPGGRTTTTVGLEASHYDQ